MKVDNALIMAAGASSRFAPLSYEKPKALIDVRGEILIERQIRQLLAAGISDIYIAVGYKAEQFEYLTGKYGVHLIQNHEYLTRNNNSSIWAAKDILRNTYICSADNYFTENPFEAEVDHAYYAAVYVSGQTDEWCMHEDEEGFVDSVVVGGNDSWVMLGQSFWDEAFSRKFLDILQKEYQDPDTAVKLWETIYIEHIADLKLKIRKYDADRIFEFDTLDELREFDKSYRTNTRSSILKSIASELGVGEECLVHLCTLKDHTAEAIGFTFDCGNRQYRYFYDQKRLENL